MKRVTRYYLQSIGYYCVLFFLTAFILASIVLSITLASSTAIIKLSAGEFVNLYLLQVPQLIYYISPVSFVAGVIIGLGKMALELEIIVFFSLKASRQFFLKPLFVLTVCISLISFVSGFFLFPLSKSASKNLVELKKSTAELNVATNEFGQKFGNWLVFVSGTTPQGDYQDVVLYKKEKDGEYLVRAASGKVLLENSTFDFTASKGQAYSINLEHHNEKVGVVEFDTMNLSKEASQGRFLAMAVYEYWLESITNATRAKDFMLLLFLSFFPLFALPWYLSLSFFNPRYEKNRVPLKTVLFIIGYLVSAFIGISLMRWGALIVLPSLWVGLGVMYYYRNVRYLY